MAARPALNGGRIPDTTDAPFYNTSDVEHAFSGLLACAPVLGDTVQGYAYDLVAVGRQVLSDRFNAARALFAEAAAAGAGRSNIGAATARVPSALPLPVTVSDQPAWHCVHYTAKEGARCSGFPPATALACQEHICTSAPHDGNFSHDKASNKGFPGCGTCWCCAKGAGPPPPPDVDTLKQLGAKLLGLIDSMDTLLGTHAAFLLGKPWLADAEAWAARSSTLAHGVGLMQDARRIITLWGHPSGVGDKDDSHLSQYSYVAASSWFPAAHVTASLSSFC